MSKLLIQSLTPNRTSKELSIPELATAGFLSAIPSTLVTAPVERAKVLLQVRRYVRVYSGYLIDTTCTRSRDRDKAALSIRVFSMS